MNVLILIILSACLACPLACAQGNYEIQVYGADTVPAGNTMFELHSNYTARGQQRYLHGVAPTYGAEHETLEITQGLTDWSELGFYFFTSEKPDAGMDWVGDHLRPRFRVPETWGWPIGFSISQEIGYQRARFSPDTWTWEIRPIVDKQQGRLYWSINPALERTLHGPDVNLGLDFAPAVKVGWDFTKVVNAGIEYYADYGSIRSIAPLHDQQQQIFAVTDLTVSPNWELNFGVGIGPTAATDHWIIKGIVGRRFSWGKPKRRPQPHQP